MKKLKTILMMAGGTGGHVYPGLAVAHYFREQGIEVHWLGTAKGMEAQLVPQAGFPLHFIAISGVKGKSIQHKLLLPYRLMIALVQSLAIIQKLKPDVVIGMGGFVSGPGGLACALLRRNLVVHEQNARPGLTNRYLAKLADKVLAGFPNVFPNNRKVLTIGNPVRVEILNLPVPAQRFQAGKRPLRLLVLGGSLGAEAINEIVPKTLAKMPQQDRPEVIHQTGEKLFLQAKKLYEELAVSAQVKPFIREMHLVYGWADIVLCRAGALTVSELCAAGLGSILVPFPFATDDHQTANANYLTQNQAAILVPQSELTEDRLLRELKKFQAAPEKCREMAEAAYQLRKTDAAKQVLTICQEICH